MSEPAFSREGVALYCGDCREVLASLPDDSAQCCVTSPPYWGLRKYEGVEPAEWGGTDSAEVLESSSAQASSPTERRNQ